MKGNLVLPRSNQTNENEKKRRKLVVGLLAVGVSTLVAGGSAIAYYSLSATGSGSTHATLVTPTGTATVTVTITCTHLTTIEPGQTKTCTYTLTNTSTHEVRITYASLNLDSATTASCPVSWFHLTRTYIVTPSTPAIFLAPSGHHTGEFNVTFTNKTLTQDGCWTNTISIWISLTT
jgi:hypothetical protein